MDTTETISAQLQPAWDWIETEILSGRYFGTTFLTWLGIQLAIVLLSFVLARIVAGYVNEPAEARLRQVKENRPLLKLLAVLFRKLDFILFISFMWIAYAVLRQWAWPSYSFVLGVIASLASAWLVISLAGQLIRNPLIRKLVVVVTWAITALNILGILPETLLLLDAIAIDIQDFRLSLLMVIEGILFLSALLWISAVFGRFAENRINKLEDFTPSIRVLITKALKGALIFLAVMIALQSIGVDFTALAFFSGAVGVGVGFGMQKIVSNLISGIILLMDKSIKPGDVISVDGEAYGRIDSLNARYVAITARDGREYLIPNEDLITQQVLNWTHTSPMVRLDVDFGVSYSSDPHVVREVARQAAAEHPRVVATPKPVCHMTGYEDSSIDFKLRFWVRDPAAGVVNIRGDIMLRMWDAFAEKGIQFPFPHREIIMKTPVEIRQAGPRKKAS